MDHGMFHMSCPRTQGLGLHLLPNVMEEHEVALGWVLFFFKIFLLHHVIGELCKYKPFSLTDQESPKWNVPIMNY